MTAPFPTKQQILAFIEETGSTATKRDIARAFHIKGQDRIALKALLKEMQAEGLIDKDIGKKAVRPAGLLPSVTIIEVWRIDEEGEAIARPIKWDGETPAPKIHLREERGRRQAALVLRDRALARLTPLDSKGRRYSASIIRKLDAANRTILGIFRGSDHGGNLVPVDKSAKGELIIAAEHQNGAADGDLVVAQPLPGRAFGLRPAKIVERLGDISAPKSISLIAIHANAIPVDFPDAAIREAENARPVGLQGREDMRSLPFITIDPSDARDHDDALYAEPLDSGGYRLLVAIADVAHYVRPGSALDRAARERGNSCYFPDRVVPMLPEALSTDLCSLKPGVDRAALVADLRIDRRGELVEHRFCRALIRSHANLTYQAAQAALDGAPDADTRPLLDPVLSPLHQAYRLLSRARDRREPLDLDLPERRILLDDDGKVRGIINRERLEAHRLVEECMILANVAAAQSLEARATACMYRVHEEPPMDKLELLRDFLKTLDMTVAKGQVLKPRAFNGILKAAAGRPEERLVNDMVLRSQTQAYYSPDNRGHFGLALPRYAHFTSPIRRYADILVHRGLITANGLGGDGLSDQDREQMDATGELISKAERRAMAAERETIDRYLAAFLADRVGGDFLGRISGVTRFGLFVTLEPHGGDGLIPISTLGDDYYEHVEAEAALIGRRSGQRFRLGDRVDVRLIEADRVSGGIRLELSGTSPAGARHRRMAGKPPRKQARRRPSHRQQP